MTFFKYFIFTFIFSLNAQASLKVMTTTSDLAALTKIIGQDHLEIFAVAKGTQDPHHIEAKPSFMVKFHNADLVVSQGLELESAWLDPLITGARNPKIAQGTQGFLELGSQLNPLEVPTGVVSRAQGDVHPGGNPHFQLDPLRMGKAALIIADRLSQLQPENKDEFQKHAKDFKTEIEKKTKLWQKRIQETGIKEIVTHHKTLTYFCSRFQIKCDIQLEPKPGIPPTASHLLDVIHQMKEKHLKTIFIENYFDDDSPQKIKTQISNISVDRVPVSVGGEPEIQTLEQLYERLISAVEKAAQ
ncbi:MAG: zinc ABC transporter substrate-binding protein [Bdellovibrionales bacterium]|nr:zinc ABC transporter substrate-binding protein [Bdellovibrionales bacterium]